LIDELDNRLPHGRAASEVRFVRQNGMLSVNTPAWSQAAEQEVRERWRAAFEECIDIVRCES
jgi:tRNA A-37 threonylcarbamoyl transferase component Bud32